jgi:hypothetical protein
VKLPIAQMKPTPNGRWTLYVVLPGRGDWPQALLEGDAIPTASERLEVLAALGFKSTPGTEWEWQETQDTPDEPVQLLATVPVQQIGDAS